MTLNFTAREYLDALRTVINDRGPEYRGAPPSDTPPGDSSCSYLPASMSEWVEVPGGRRYTRMSPDRCVHGQALHNLGVGDVFLARIEGEGIDSVFYENGIGDDAFVGVMGLLQRRQDAGDEYGKLLWLVEDAEQYV